MKTTATNRKIRMLLTAIRDNTLVPKPEFQRRLVWTNKDKKAFLDTVLRGYPFPEIYIAAGEVDPDTGEGKEMLVDGQQRITTLHQYFTGSPALKLGKDIKPYKDLAQEDKIAFLEYEVVVRDLGKIGIVEIKEVFKRINATKYSLNDMEIHNARFAGEFKSFAEHVSQNQFFERHRIFSANEIRRMSDVGFAVTFVITIMSSYFNRDDEFENYLSTYNDEFDMKDDLEKNIQVDFAFIESCNLSDDSRAWKKSDLLSLLVEIDRLLNKDKLKLDPVAVGEQLKEFYFSVDLVSQGGQLDGNLDKAKQKDIQDYAKAASQATNDRGSRIRRGEILRQIMTQK